jgi:ABC-2 type transport system permease protein
LAAVIVVPRRFLQGSEIRYPEVEGRADSAVATSVARAVADAMGEAAVVARRTVAEAPDLGVVARVVQAAPAVAIEDAGGGTVKSLLGYFGPAMAMVFLFFGIGAAARSVLAEREAGTLARLRAAPIPFGHVLAGKLLAMMAVSLTSVAVVWATTSWVLGASWGDPLGVLALTLALVLAMGAIALLVAVLDRTQEQADAVTAGVGFTLAMLGGNFFPPGSLPPVFQGLSLLTPNGWALQGYGSLAIDQRGFESVIGPLLALLAIGALIGTVAVTRFRRRMAA